MSSSLSPRFVVLPGMFDPTHIASMWNIGPKNFHMRAVAIGSLN